MLSQVWSVCQVEYAAMAMGRTRYQMNSGLESEIEPGGLV